MSHPVSAKASSGVSMGTSFRTLWPRRKKGVNETASQSSRSSKDVAVAPAPSLVRGTSSPDAQECRHASWFELQRPILDLKTRDARHVFGVCGDEDTTLSQCVGCDGGVEVLDAHPLALERKLDGPEGVTHIV